MESCLLPFILTLFIGRRGALLTLHPHFWKTLYFALWALRGVKKKTTQKTRKNKKPFLSKRFVKGGINFTFDVHF